MAALLEYLLSILLCIADLAVPSGYVMRNVLQLISIYICTYQQHIPVVGPHDH